MNMYENDETMVDSVKPKLFTTLDLGFESSLEAANHYP